MFGTPASKVGLSSVLLLQTESAPPPDSEQLEFDPGHVRVLNLGKTNRVLLVYAATELPDADERQVANYKYGPAVWKDDDALEAEIKALPAHLAKAANEMIGQIRSAHPGFFQRTQLGRFVNRPNNFWTIKPQPRDESLRVTLRGNPASFERIEGLTVKPDRNGYSTFKISDPKQVPAAKRAILQAGAA